MTKQAMVESLYKEGLVPLTQIHDEIAMSVKNKGSKRNILLI